MFLSYYLLKHYFFNIALPDGEYHHGPSAQQWMGKMKQLEYTGM